MKKLFAVFLPLVGAVSCLDGRERLQPPRVYLNLRDTSILPGERLYGRVSGYDASGIVYVNAQLAIEGDTARPQSSSASGFEADTVDYNFNFPVKAGLAPGTRLFVSATVRDDENFEVTIADTSVIR